MKALLLVLISIFTIAISSLSIAQPEQVQQNTTVFTSPVDGDGYTYEYIEIDGKSFVYVYLEGLLIEIYEEED